MCVCVCVCVCFVCVCVLLLLFLFLLLFLLLLLFVGDFVLLFCCFNLFVIIKRFAVSTKKKKKKKPCLNYKKKKSDNEICSDTKNGKTLQMVTFIIESVQPPYSSCNSTSTFFDTLIATLSPTAKHSSSTSTLPSLASPSPPNFAPYKELPNCDCPSVPTSFVLLFCLSVSSLSTTVPESFFFQSSSD